MNLNHSHWQSTSPEHLVQLGKSAAHTAETSGISLTNAVVREIGMTKLNSEQVRRVVEAANHEAFHRKFASMDANSRVVDLEGGPADFNAVTERLAIQATPQKVASYRNDYAMGPQYPSRVASTSSTMTKAAALDGVVELRGQLESMHEELTTSAHAKQAQVETSLHTVTHHVRQALMSGAYHEDIERAWGHFNPKFATELASSFTLPKAPAGVKVASRQIPQDHPLVSSFASFVKVAKEYEELCVQIREVEKNLLRVGDHLRGHS